MAHTIKELAETLSLMQEQADNNAVNINKLLASINSQLEFMEQNTEAEDLIKIYLAELKKTMEERHVHTLSEFSQIGNSLDVIARMQQETIKSADMERIFSIFSNNILTIKNELTTHDENLQKVITDFNSFKNDKTDKTEMLDLMNIIKTDFELANRNFEKSVAEINENTQSIIKNLVVMDPAAQNDIIKQELENIYITTGSILSYVNESGGKFDSIISSLEKLLTKDDLNNYKEEISTQISKAEGRINEAFKTVEEKVDDIALACNDSKILYEFENIKKLMNDKKDEIIDGINPEKINEISDLLNNLSKTVSDIKSEDLPNNSEALAEIIRQNFEETINKINSIDFTPVTKHIEDLKKQTENIENEMTTIAHQSDIADLYSSINEFSKILDHLRNTISSSNEQTNELIRNQLDNLSNVLNNTITEEEFADFKQELREFINQITDNSSNLNDNITYQKDILDKIQAALDSNAESSSNKLSEIEENIRKIMDNLNNLSNSFNQESDENITKIDEIKSFMNDILGTCSSFNYEQENRDSKLMSMISSELELLSSKIDELKVPDQTNEQDTNEEDADKTNQQLELLSEKIETLHQNILNLCNDTEFEKIHNKISSTEDVINDNINILREMIIDSDKEESLTEKLIGLRNVIIEKSESQTENMLYLQKKIDDFLKAGERISSEAEIKIGNSVSELADLKNEINEMAATFSKWNYEKDQYDAAVTSQISKELDILKNSLGEMQNSVQNGIYETINNNSEAVEKQLNNIIGCINDFKEEIKQQQEADNEDTSEISDLNDIKDKMTALKQEINLVNTDISDIITSNTEALMREIAPLKAALGVITVNKTELFSKVNQDNDTNNSNNSNNDENLIRIIEELKNRIDNLSSNNNEMKNIIHAAVNNDELKLSMDEFKNTLSARISENNTSINEILDTINEKIDIIAQSDNAELSYDIEEIKNMISYQKEILESSGSDKLNSIEKKLKELMNKLNSTDMSSENQNKIKEDIIEAIVSVFEQISFIEESEDIKDFVEEKTDEINQSLIEVKKQLNQFVSGEDEYSYTLQDVESDIAKLRLVLNDLSNTSSQEELSDISENIHRIVTSVEDMKTTLTQEQVTDLKSDFEKLSEDILSISSRTNKLLLTSDESYNALSNGLNDFTNVISQLEARINYLDNKEISERIEEKLDRTFNIAASSANSDKVMRQALMYMGEWIDTATEKLDSISEYTNNQNNESKKLYSVIEDLRSGMPGQKELISTITMQFDEQQERMDRLEQKLEKVLNAIDNIDDAKLHNKVDKIDKQIKNLTSTIEKLATYVDE